MKRTILLITGAIIIIAACAIFTITGGPETVIVNPEFDNTNVDYISLHKIERTDTATILYADVYHLPNYWIYLSSSGKLRDSKGKTYKLLDCKGFELDKEVYMPASGSMSLVLYFEPVDKTEKVVDYIDMDENNEVITDIKLYNVKHNEPVRCLLKGEVIDRPQSSRMALLKQGEDFRAAKVTCIPIHDGKFEYMLYANFEEAYQLIFYDEIMKSSWRPVDFIAESGTCRFILHNGGIHGGSNEWEKNSVHGGKYTETYLAIIDSLRKEMEPFEKELDAKLSKLYEEKKYYTPEANNLIEQAEKASDNDPKRTALWERFYKMENVGTSKTQETKDLENELAQIYRTMYVDKLTEYAKEHADITGYTFLVENIRSAMGHNHDQLDVTSLFAVFHDTYEKKYPNHPYTSLIKNHMQANAVAIGNPCPDITAEDNEGNEVNVSELIKGKVALIHLWASWCGTCRRHGKEMIPIYETYKDKGFTVVGIAREQTKESMLNALDKDNYPWINLLELNDKNGIWTKFGVGNAGGGEFLVDAQGNFLAVGTSPEEIE
ncbi:MAG: redoxin domain-containing protein, partial [Prevotellaceae bacterium]|nr:redoxin domain-containing protein [Prevotellaceae bacterium]